jgi:DNA-binding MarR family transcriptional regulator
MPIQHYRTETFLGRSSLGYLLKRAHVGVVDVLEELVAPSGLTITHWVILINLRDGVSMTAADLCTQLRHDSGALTRLIDQLESRGLVERERSREDRRAVQLRLTDAGTKLLQTLLPQVVERLNFVLRDFSRSELAEFVRLLTKFIASTDSLVPGSKAQRDATVVSPSAESPS